MAWTKPGKSQIMCKINPSEYIKILHLITKKYRFSQQDTVNQNNMETAKLCKQAEY